MSLHLTARTTIEPQRVLASTVQSILTSRTQTGLLWEVCLVFTTTVGLFG